MFPQVKGKVARQAHVAIPQGTYETLVEQNVVAIGDPEEIVRLARLYEAAGLTHFLAITNKHVFPAFR